MSNFRGVLDQPKPFIESLLWGEGYQHISFFCQRNGKSFPKIPVLVFADVQLQFFTAVGTEDHHPGAFHPAGQYRGIEGYLLPFIK